MASVTALTRFLQTFVLPLVAGGKVEVHGLVGPGMLERFNADGLPDATVLAEVTSHVRAHIARIGPVGAIDLLTPDAIALAAVWHNLIAMTHPEVSPRARLRRRVRAWSAKMLEWVGVPRTAGEVALRYGVLARLGDVGRVDTDVAFWAGSAKFVGVAPPPRLLIWRTVRRVREQKARVAFFDLLSALRSETIDLDLLEPARTALALSPLTDVALADRPSSLAGFLWTNASVNMLADGPLRGATIRLVLGSTAARDRAPTRIAVVERATRQSVAEGLPRTAANTLITFHLEALVTDALARGSAPTGHTLAWDAVARLGHARSANVVGLPREQFEHSLGLDAQMREPLKDKPSVALLERAGFLEVSS